MMAATVKFWDSVATVYSDNEMTQCNSDFELETLCHKVITEQPTTLNCFGVADGNRDPIFILDYIEKQGWSLPAHMVINDISPEMVNQATNNITDKYDIPTRYVVSPIDSLHLPSRYVKSNTKLFIGTYSISYIKDALKLYEKEKDIIGAHVTLTQVFYTAGQLQTGKSQTGSYSELNVDELFDEDLYAIRFETETGFVSHYFNEPVLYCLLGNIFRTEADIFVSEKYPRYGLMSLNKTVDHTTDVHVVTMLNNVLGNIKTEDQIESLFRLKFYFWGEDEEAISFLPSSDPLITLPDKYESWEAIARNLPILNEEHATREVIDKMPFVDNSVPPSVEEDRLSYLWLSQMAQSYVWSHGLENGIGKLPKQLAVPLAICASRLGIKPVLTHSCVDLWNYVRIVSTKGLVVNNLGLNTSMTGTPDEEGFFLTITAIEALGKRIYGPMFNVPNMILLNDHGGVSIVMKSFIETMKEINKTLLGINEVCDPDVFYNILRTYLHGWGHSEHLPEGLVFEGVSDIPVKMYGGSAAQSSLIAMFDVFLGIEHKTDANSKYMKSIRHYMPTHHRHILEHLDELMKQSPLAEFTKEHGIEDEYKQCVDIVRKFRTLHFGIVAKYIIKMAPKSKDDIKGTGSTPLKKFLNACIEDTNVST
jgi:indoleamine 2,3-dioxygenase